MNAIDLLLAAGDTVEKVHQAAWFALLQHTDFASHLGLETQTHREILWEPAGGLFDLAVKSGDHAIWIELKVDSELSQSQVERQLSRSNADRVIHALLGFSDIRSRPWLTTKIEERGGKLLTAAQVSQALRVVTTSEGVSQGAQELARSYADQLAKLSRRGEDFRSTDSWQSCHELYFFSQLRQACPEMKDAIVCYVANPAGGFEACHWGWTGANSGVDCYLQWEGRRLCFKISVQEPASCQSTRLAAVEFLRDKPLGRTTIKRPARLGSGQTMTVGVVEDLSIRDEAQWPLVLQAMSNATQLTMNLARHLRTN